MSNSGNWSRAGEGSDLISIRTLTHSLQFISQQQRHSQAQVGVSEGVAPAAETDAGIVK